MKKDELIHFIDLMINSDSYFKKLLILELFRKYLNVEDERLIKTINDLELRRKINLRDGMILSEGFSYFVDKGITDNVYFPKYDIELEKELLEIDKNLVDLSVKFIKEIIDDTEYNFEKG